MTIITVYALFGDDIRQLAAPESADETFWTLNIAVMAAFTIEIVISCISKVFSISPFDLLFKMKKKCFVKKFPLLKKFIAQTFFLFF